MDRGQITRKSYESNHIFFSSRRELSNPRRELSNPRRELSNPRRELSNSRCELKKIQKDDSFFPECFVSLPVGKTSFCLFHFYFNLIIYHGRIHQTGNE